MRFVIASLERITRVVDTISEWTGRLMWPLIVVLTGLVVYEVVLRYVFNRPTIWAFEVEYMLGSFFWMIGFAYCLKHKGHVRVDFLYNRWSARGQAITDLVFMVAMFFPVFGLLVWEMVPWVHRSWVTQEKSLLGFWYPPLYPWKTAILVAFSLLVLQGIAEFIRNLFTVIRGRAA